MTASTLPMLRKFLSVLVTASVVGFASACAQENNSVAEAVPPSSHAPIKINEPPVEEVVVPGIPKSNWEPIFFESIDERTSIAKIDDLRMHLLATNDIEVRVWYGFGLTTLEGLILSRKRGNWSAHYLYEKFVNEDFVHRTEKLPEPYAGWEATWRSLLKEGLLTLPDADEIKCEVPMHDGFSYVVEIKKGSNYRTYMYGNPDVAVRDLKCKQAASMIKISKIIEDRFDLEKLRSQP